MTASNESVISQSLNSALDTSSTLLMSLVMGSSLAVLETLNCSRGWDNRILKQRTPYGYNEQ